MKRKQKENPEEKLRRALSPDYQGTKEQRQTDINESWTELHGKPDPKRQKQNGVVYTPAEIVDFIINSVSLLSEREFGVTLNSDSVKVIDPAAGTGIFGARLADLGFSVDNLECIETDPESAEIANRNISISAGKPYNGYITADSFQMYEDHPELFGRAANVKTEEK